MQDLSAKSAYELKTPYAFWQDSEGIPAYGGYWIQNVRTLGVADWERAGGRGALVNLNGGGLKSARPQNIKPPEQGRRPRRPTPFEHPFIFGVPRLFPRCA